MHVQQLEKRQSVFIICNISESQECRALPGLMVLYDMQICPFTFYYEVVDLLHSNSYIYNAKQYIYNYRDGLREMRL